MFLGTYNLGEHVAFNFQALDGFGEAATPDAAPTFEVYCDNTPMDPPVTGLMSQIDGQTGFYGGTVAATLDNGFAGSAAYTIRITAVIAGVETLTTRTFQIGAFAAPDPSVCPATPVDWQLDCDDAFSRGLVALAVACINGLDAVDVVYQPDGAAARTVRALIAYDPPSATPAPHGHAPQTQVSVLNSDAVGISSAEVDTGRDTLRLPIRVGGTVQTRRITRIVAQDVGMMTLETR